MNDKLYNYPLNKIYPLLRDKALKKGRREDEVLSVFSNLLGYSKEDILALSLTEMKYGDFFKNAPSLNNNRYSVKGTICKIKIESITDPLEKDIRILDKLIDELAKGKPLEKILL